MTIMHNMNDQMSAIHMTGDADHDFASLMVMHHQAAIDMGNKKLEKGHDVTIKAMAQTMIDIAATKSTYRDYPGEPAVNPGEIMHRSHYTSIPDIRIVIQSFQI